jgi:hypothetical protein
VEVGRRRLLGLSLLELLKLSESLPQEPLRVVELPRAGAWWRALVAEIKQPVVAAQWTSGKFEIHRSLGLEAELAADGVRGVI